MCEADDRARFEAEKARLQRLPTAELFAAARTEIEHDVGGYPRASALVRLHERPTREVFERAAGLLDADDPLDRTLGARVLRELGCTGDEDRWRPFTGEVVPLLVARLGREPDVAVLIWVISALGYNGAREALADVLLFADHPDVLVRYEVAANLPALVDPAGIEPEAADALLRLCHDADADTRWYALTALVEEVVGVDPGRVRETLCALADDPDQQIRALARRPPGTGYTPRR